VRCGIDADATRSNNRVGGDRVLRQRPSAALTSLEHVELMIVIIAF
jgi:hypothetical protein